MLSPTTGRRGANACDTQSWTPFPASDPSGNRSLLRQFKSLTAIGQATIPELERILPKDAAAAVYRHFHAREETRYED